MAHSSRSKSDESGGTTLGKTERTSIQISADDGTVFPAQVYTGVNVTTDPQLRQQLREGTLNEVAAPGDEDRTYRPAVPVVVHDEEKKLFALVIPEALRHEEFRCRTDLLERLAARRDVVPEYMRRFEVVFDPAELDRLAATGGRPQPAADGADGDRPQSIDEERKQLEIDRKQLEEVATRVERDSARVEDARNEIEEERAELEQLREELEEQKRALQVQELNLEQEKLRLKNEGGGADSDKPHADESTQVVTDDQFIEVVDAGDAEAEDAAGADADAVAAAQPRRPEPTAPAIAADESETIFDDFDQVDSGVVPWFVESTDDLVVAGVRLDDEQRAQVFRDEQPRFLFQLHEVDGIPVIALTLASMTGDGECVDAVTVPLTDRDERERTILDKLARDLHLHFALYGPEGERLASWEAGAPIRRNIGWARQRLRQWRDETEEPERVGSAAERVGGGEIELVGSMHHPFDTQRFVDFQGASDVKLAVGIVGYWSQPEQFEYLIGNRSFPLQTFLDIQTRVVRQALHWGIAPGEALSDVALDQGIAVDGPSLTQGLLSNFAEVCVGLRPNDLDPIEQWENWDQLIARADAHGITPDPDVLELAEVSLNRAEKYEEQMFAEEQAEDGVDQVPTEGKPEADGHRGLDELTVERHCEVSGVTYFWPGDDGGDDHFGELVSQGRDEWTEALGDPERRLEAAQILLEEVGADAVADVLEAAEEMELAQVAALARFAQERADGLEGALMQALETAGPLATLVAARGLAAIGSTAAMPRLLDAARDPKRRGPQLARCVARFGEKLVPVLSRALKEHPDDDDLVAVLAALERTRRGTLDELSSERNEGLKQAAERARHMV